MRDDLVAAALRDGSPVLKSQLQATIEKCGEARLTLMSLQMIEQVAGTHSDVEVQERRLHAESPHQATAAFRRSLVSGARSRE